MTIADQIQSTANIEGGGTINIISYGRPGVGKTWAVRTMPGDTIMFSSESGGISLADTETDYIDVDSVGALLEATKWVEGADHDYDSLALDSVSEMAQMILEYELSQTSHGQQAYGKMADRVRKMMRRFRGLDMNVYFSAKQARDTSGALIKKMPDFPGNSLNDNNSIAHDFDFVFPLICTDELNPTDESLKCSDGRYRYFLTEPQDEWIAGKRDPHHALDPREPIDITAIRDKVIGGGQDG